VTGASYGDGVRSAQSYELNTNGAAGALAQDAVADFVAAARGAAWSAMVGLPLGRRERSQGHLTTLAEIHIQAVAEYTHDLAIADRVAYVLAHHTGATHAVIAADGHWLICRLNEEDAGGSGADGIAWYGNAQIASIATSTHVVPIS
jgi:hypothetical protein